MGVINGAQFSVHRDKVVAHSIDLYKDLNTGDLVFFRCYDYDEFYNALYLVTPAIFSNIYFTHIGMIYKNKNYSFIKTFIIIFIKLLNLLLSMVG